MSLSLRRSGSVSILVLLAASAAFFVPWGTAGAQTLPPAPLEVLASETFQTTASDGDEISTDTPLPAGTEMIFVAVSTGAMGMSAVDYVNVGGPMELVGETDGMAALDMRTAVYYRTFPTPPTADTLGELLVGIVTAFQDPLTVIISTACVRGADMTHFPGAGTAYSGPVFESGSAVFGEVDYDATHDFRRGDSLLTFIGTAGVMEGAGAPGMQELSQDGGGGMWGAAAVSRINAPTSSVYVAWEETATQHSMFMIPLRSRSFGTVQVNITPQAAITAGARWRVPGGEWLASGALAAGQPLGVWPFELRDVTGFEAPPNPEVEVLAEELTEVQARYHRVGSVEVLKTETLQGVVTEAGGYEFSYSGDTPWEAELVLLVLSARHVGGIEIESGAPLGLSAYQGTSSEYPQELLTYGPSSETGIQTRVFFMKRPQLLPGAPYTGSMILNPLGGLGDVPYTFTVVFLRGVGLDAFSHPWDAARKFPLPVTLTGEGTAASYEVEPHAKPLNGASVFTVLASPGPLGGATDPYQTELWHATAPGDGLATVGTMRQFEQELDDTLMTWDVAAEDRGWDLAMITLPPAGRGDLKGVLDDVSADSEALWRIDGGGWNVSGGTAPQISSGWHWMDFKNPDARKYRTPSPRWVHVADGALTTERASFSRQGIPHPVYQFSFTGKTDSHGVLRMRSVMKPGATGVLGALTVAALGSVSGEAVLVREGASNTFTKWVQSDEAVADRARATLFFRKNHTVPADGTWRFECGAPNTVVSGAVMVFTHVRTSAIPDAAPFTNVAGDGGTVSPANVDNPLTGASQWDVLCGAIQAEGTLELDYAGTPFQMNPAQLWGESVPGATSAPLRSLAGYTALAAPPKMAGQQGPTFDTGRAWGGAEAMLPFARGTVTVTIDPPALAGRAEMVWSVAGSVAVHASGESGTALCGWQQLDVFQPTDYKLADPEELWVNVPEDGTVAVTLHYVPILASGLRIYVLPVEAAQGGATWRVKGRTPEDTWHGDGYVFTGITAQDLAAGNLELEFTGASGFGDYSTPPDQAFEIVEGETKEYTVVWKQYGGVNFRVEPPEAAAQNPLWRFAGTETWYTPDDVGEAEIGSRTVEFEALEGWRAPVLDVHVPFNAVGTYTVRYEPWGTPRLVGQSHWSGDTDGSGTEVDIALPRPLPEFSVVAVTWQRDIAAPVQISLDQVQNYTLWGSTSSGSARAALFYLKSPDTPEMQQNRLHIAFAGTVPVFTMQVYCMFFNDVDLDAPLGSAWTGSGTAPTAAHSGPETFGVGDEGSLLLDLMSVASGEFSPRLDTALHAEDRDLAWVWRGQDESKALLGGGGLVTGKVFTGGSYENGITWDCAADWGGIMAAVPPARGQLQVNIAPAAAVTAGVKWNAQPVYGTGYDSGFTRTDVNLGENPLSHNHINGWTPDPSAATTANVLPDVPNTHSYAFVESARGGVRVNIFPAAAAAAGAQWKLTSEATMLWQDGGAAYTDMAQAEKNYIIEYNETVGWTAPGRQNVWVSEGEVTEVSVMFSQAGALRATLERDGAPVAGNYWIYAPDQLLAASGETIPNIPPGMYDISVPPVNDYLSPQNTRVLINPGETVDLVLRYEKLPAVGENELLHPGSVTCVINPPEAAAAGARWRMEGYAWANSGETVSNVRPGVVQVLCDHVEGWYPVAPITAVVPAGRGATVNAYYQPVQAHTLGLIPEIEAVHGVPTAVQVLVPEGMPPGTVLSYSLSAAPDGPITFNPSSGVFTYTAAETDGTPFQVTFCAAPAGGDPVCQTVLVRPVSAPVTEEETVKPDDPNAGIPDEESKDYITFTEENHATYLEWNGQKNQLVKNVMVTGKTLRIQTGHPNNLFQELNNNKNLKRVQLFAEKVVIAGGLRLPGADLTITARELVFEDLPENRGAISLTPYPNTLAPTVGEPGAPGQNSGNLILNIEQCRFDHSVSLKRFILMGAKGQAGGPGQDGVPGDTFETVGSKSFGWQDKVESAGVDSDIRREMVGHLVYLHNADVSQARGVASWPKPHTELIPRGTPGSGGEYGTVTAPFGELAALIDADYGPGGDLNPTIPQPAPAETPHPDPAFWLWVGDPDTDGPSAATRAREDVQNLNLKRRSRNDWVVYYYRNEDPVQERITDSTGIALIAPRPAPPLERSDFGAEDDWICPEVMQPALLYLKDLHLNGHTTRARDLAMEYLNRIYGRLAYHPPYATEARLLQALADEILSVYDRAAKGLDYFGNPMGWAPMLSFEANATLYRDEFESAIPMLFLARWIEADARRTEKSLVGLDTAIQEKNREINKLKEDLNEARGKLPGLATTAAALEVEESSLTQQKDALEAWLLEQAKEDAETSWITTALKVVSGVLKVLPFPEAQIAGGVLGMMTEGFSWDSAARVADQGITFGLGGQVTDFSAGLDQVWGVVSGVGASDLPSQAQAAALYDEYKTQLAGLSAQSEQFRAAASTQGASDDQVQAILDELRAKSHKLHQLLARLDALVTEKSAANTAFSSMETAANAAAKGLGNAIVELGSLHEARTSNLRSQDHRARQVFKAMDQRARHRLLKQHYYMAKAYEFRTLQPYPHPLELSTDILDSLMAKVTEHTVPGDPASPLHGPTLSPEEITALKTPFEDQMRDIVSRFVDDANSNSPDLAQEYTWLLTPEQLDELNRSKQITINLQHLGRLLTSQDNHRVARIWTDTLGVAYTGTDPDPILSVTYTHSGVSRMRYQGKTLAFQHYKDANRTPMQWATTCDYFGQVLSWTENPISPQSTSMLSFITGGLDHDQFYYCVPSAWADIVVRLEGARADFTVDQLRIGFEIYYTPKQPAVCDIYVAPPEGLRPPVMVDRASNGTGLQNGAGEFFRQYSEGAGTVTFSTVAQHGAYVFSHWLLDGNPVYTKADAPSINVPTTSGHVLAPVFTPAPVPVPDLDGMDYSVRVEPPPGTDMAGYVYPVEAYSDAEFKLVTEGLALGSVRYEQTGDDADKGKVLRQYPATGMTVAKDSEVHLAVSTGTDPAGEDPLDAAMAALLAAFDALDTDASGGLSWDEALVGYPGLWPEDFTALDTDASGELSPEEVGYVPPLCEIGSRLSVFRMLQLFAGDPDADGHLTKDEFQALTGFISIQMNNWGQLDTNGDNRASMPEFEVSPWTALAPLFTLDTNEDNALSLAEYQVFNPALPAAVFNAADLTTPKNGLIDCDDLEFVVVTVPDLAGLTQAEADAAIVAAGLAVGQHATQYSDTVPAGEVIQQNPLAGASAAPGDMVHMVLSLGPQPVPVPDITGLAQAAAEAALTGAGLVVGQVSEAYNATVPAGSVISQNPAAGTEVLPGTPVSFVVSLGVRMIAVPNLSGMTAAEAEAVLLGAGLTLGAVTQQNSATVPAGQVMGQTPAAGVELVEGSAVAVVVSLGPLPVAVPNVTGMAQAAATTALTGAGLAVGQVSESYSATVPAGSVISQNPAAGTLVLPGAAVALEVSKGPAPTGDIAVPNLVGMTQAQAATALTTVDLALGTVTEVYSATVPAGQVVGQSPAAGVEVASGTAVNITVSKGPAPAVVPDVTGMTQANAAAALTGAGLAVGAVTEAYSATIPAGRVISQNPEAGAEVPPGSAVRLEVSKGPAPAGDIAVPNLAGLTQAQASAALTGVGLALGAVTESYSATVPAGQGIGQNPAAATMVAAGTAVNITLSKGPAPVAVPGVTGMTQANAATALTGAGLSVGTVTQAYHATVPAGSVISQDPAAGTEVAAGSTVDLNVSKGPVPAGDVAVPNLAGLTQSQAGAALTTAGLALGAVTESYSATVPAGQVMGQSPAAGVPVPSGTEVSITVSKGPQPVSVPDVTWMTQSSAVPALTGAGLAVGTVTQAYSTTVPAGRVISQNPVAAAQVPPGSAVDLEVSKGPAPAGSIEVPNLAGKTQTQAATALTDATLALGAVTEAYSATVPAGSVISQNPAAGAMVAAATPVNIVLSKGPDPAAVPDTTYMTAAAAGNAITSAGFVVGQTTEVCSDVPEGRVVRTDPAAGTLVDPGSVVHLVVSSGPCVVSVAVPNVSGLTAAAAGTALTGAGLVVGQTAEECSNTVPAGAVIRTNPASGTMVNPGTVVALVVSSGPCPVAVPNVAGLTQSAATADITGAGLTVGTVTEAFSDTVPAGSVISQSPAAGAQALPGTAVALVVSKGVDQTVVDASRASLAGLFENADTNGDGFLSLGEVQAAAPTVTQLVFNALDTDGDGLLSAEELGVKTGCGCKKSGMTVDGFKSRLGDLFLGALALVLLAAAGRRRMP